MSGPLDHPVAHIIAQLLVDLGIATHAVDSDWRVFVESEPNNPGNVITVYDTTNDTDGWIMATGMLLERLGVQVRVRSETYMPGFTIMESVKIMFDQTVRRTQVTRDATTYLIHSMDRASGPFHIGTEENSQRDLFTINYLVTLEKT